MDRTETHISTRERLCVWRDALQKPLGKPYITVHHKALRGVQGVNILLKRKTF